MTNKKVYLVRHAQSQSNVNVYELHKTCNPSIELTPTGLLQAMEAGGFLATQGLEDVCLWNSPYKRTRQTAQIIHQALQERYSPIIQKESIYLAERQFGLVDDVPNYRHLYSHEAQHYKNHVNAGAEFFARPPLGESPFDMALRLDMFLRSYLLASAQEKHILVSHGAAIKGLTMMALGWSHERYSEEKTPANASVRLLEYVAEDPTVGQWHDRGYVFSPTLETTQPLQD